jgi:K+-transporting ATPase ATPase C chain
MLAPMFSHLRPAFFSLLVLSVITGVAYPLAVTGLAQLLFRGQANGSLIMVAEQAKGSDLIGQAFADPGHFWGRPSATSPYPYNAAASGGSNQGPLNPALVEAVSARIKALRDADPGNGAPVPVDLVTASASGLDPHISPAAAEYQLRRVAQARNLDAQKVRVLVAQATETRQFGFIGEPRVNVLRLNLALDQSK